MFSAKSVVPVTSVAVDPPHPPFTAEIFASALRPKTAARFAPDPIVNAPVTNPVTLKLSVVTALSNVTLIYHATNVTPLTTASEQDSTPRT